MVGAAEHLKDPAEPADRRRRVVASKVGQPGVVEDVRLVHLDEDRGDVVDPPRKPDVPVDVECGGLGRRDPDRPGPSLSQTNRDLVDVGPEPEREPGPAHLAVSDLSGDRDLEQLR